MNPLYALLAVRARQCALAVASLAIMAPAISADASDIYSNRENYVNKQLSLENMKFGASLGVTIGTEGLGIDVAAAYTWHASLRLGFAFMPKISSSPEAWTTSNNPETLKARLDGQLKYSHFKLLADWYPFVNRDMHLTLGFFSGTGDIINVSTAEPLPIEDGQPVQVKLGDYLIPAGPDGYAHGKITVKKFKPYLGVGFGRPVGHKRLSYAFDLGVMF